MKAGDTARSRPPRIWQRPTPGSCKRCANFRFCPVCYTQFADTYQERNGLLYADRTPKFSIELIAEATTGPEFQRFEARRQRKSSRKSARKRR